MKVPLLKKTSNNFPGFKTIFCLLLMTMVGLELAPLLAEGSKNFTGYPGLRMWLDTRDAQQLKVYVNQGEFINVGASHVGLSGGYIDVYDPSGNLVAKYDNTNNGTTMSAGLAIINDSGEEAAGPIGGANGYEPGVVPATVSGVWTVIFNYSQNYNQGTNFINLMNSAPWTRAANQPIGPRVILAWDITVSTGGAGNAPGSSLLTGRVFTNEHISLLNGNNNGTTSPTFYVLTSDGYQYEVDVNQADPFRFPISSNSLGLVKVDTNQQVLAAYQSSIDKSSTCIPEFFHRSDAPLTWMSAPDSLYLYEPQAQGFGGLKNNKLFFDIPDPTMPDSADVYDKFRNNPHRTWLFSEPVLLSVLDFNLQGTNGCDVGVIEFEKGGAIIVTTNIPGTATIQLDLDNNGIQDFGQPEDVTIVGPVGPGLPPLQWDGKNGLGEPVTVTDTLTINVTGTIRFGEIHIALEDVEANLGGVTFTMINPPSGYNGPTNEFYYDHSMINDLLPFIIPPCSPPVNPFPPTPLTGTLVSGNGASGEPISTTTPFTYTFSQGNNLYLDQWTFIEIELDTIVVPVTVVLNCECDSTETPDIAISQVDTICAGEMITLTATNSVSTFDTIFYEWTGPDGFTFNDTLTNVTDPSTVVDTMSAGGTYQVIATSNYPFYCKDTATIQVIVSPTPVLVPVQDPVQVCVGDDVQICATNSTPGIGLMTCTWTGPNGFNLVQMVDGSDTICMSLTNVDLAFSGVYTLVCSFNGCESDPLDITLEVQPAPEINGISPNGTFCAGDTVQLTATNNVLGTGPITYTWTGPNFLFTETTSSETGPFTATISNIQLADAGEYTLMLTTLAGCEAVPQSIMIEVDPSPEIDSLSGGDACVGQDVTLSGSNGMAGIAYPVTFVWSDPNGNQVCTGTVSNDGPYECVLINVQMADAGMYTLTLVDDNGCEATPESVNLNVLPGLNIVDPTPDSTYCESTDVILTATNTVNAGMITYTWTGPNGVLCGPITINWDEPLSCTISSVTAADAGDYTLTVTSDAGCVSDPVTVSVGVYPGFEILTVTGGGSYCSGDTLELNGTGDGTAASVDYVWTNPSGDTIATGAGVLTAGPFPGIDPDPQAGTYTLTATTPDGCTDSESVTVTFGETPIADILTIDTVLCELDTFTLCGQNLNPDVGFFTYTWVTPNGMTIPGAGNGTDVFCDELLPVATFGSGLYTLTLNADNCISEPDSVTIDLNPNPVISDIMGGGSYCFGDTAKLTFYNTNPAVDSFFYTCNLPGGIQITDVGATGDTICIFVTEPGMVSCSLESFDGCVSSLADTQVDFDSGFELEVSSNSPVCVNETLMLNGSNSAQCTGDVTYTWTGPNGYTFTGTAPCTGPFPADVTNPVSGDYCLSVESASGTCSDSACISVIVYELPFVSQGINGGGMFCEGDPITLTATIENPSGGDIDYTWTLDGSPISSGTAASGSTIMFELLTGTVDDSGDYCLELTCVDTGCESDGNDCTTVTIDITPIIDETSGSDVYCEGDDVQLNGSGPTGPGDVTYTWTGPNGFSFTGQAPCGGPYPATVDNVQVDQAGTYSLVVVKGDCESDEATLEFAVNPTPDIINVSGGGDECAGDTIVIAFTIDPDSANSVDWTVDGPGLSESGTVTELTEFMFDVIVDGNATYTITAVSDEDCAADPETIEITEVMIPTPPINSSIVVLCAGDDLQLTTDEVAGATYNWYKDDELIGTTTQPVFDVVPPMPGDYTVEVLLSGCSETSNVITISEPTSPDAVDDSYSGTVNETITGNILDNDDTSSGVTITITQQPSLGSVTVDQNGNMSYTSSSPGTDQFVYQICLVDCPDDCDEATVTITVIPDDCVIPNIITPNQDGTNDNLVIECLENESFPNNRLRLFNRWGDEIHVFEPYDNTWDGTFGSDKKPVPSGTYFYLFHEDKNNEDDYQAGYVKVVR